MPECLVRYFQMDSKDLVYLKFILEAYEGLATLSTEDGKKGVIRIAVPCGLENELEKLLHALRAEISFCEVEPPHFTSSIEYRPDCREYSHV
ncbi:DUF4911 domain-containing protein [Geotalea sp. SG265]|uniref:DUF4911 domain-containing protein n=1 Tax=Geotalea sp. SG265 TaxID=2922867 RepID=UPI001FAEB97A|nr:DUF4911 domain-containing protein [Geotalea sp. SG265]